MNKDTRPTERYDFYVGISNRINKHTNDIFVNSLA